MDKITTTIKRRWFEAIVEGSKKVEYREIKPYWNERFSRIKVPFLLRMISGMQAHAPEVTVKIGWKKRNWNTRTYALSIAQVVEVKNWRKSART